MDLIEVLKAENSALVAEVIKLKASEIQVEIPSQQKALGTVPWYLLKHQLEKAHRKPKLSEISGIKEQDNASEIS
jgi:hypothetical protein